MTTHSRPLTPIVTREENRGSAQTEKDAEVI